MGKRIIVYCDESAKKGKHFSNFYGATILMSEHLYEIQKRLNDITYDMGLNDEIKWNNISVGNSDRYLQFVDEVFDLIEEGRMRMRIMFTHNYMRPLGLTKEHRRDAYFILYYQFLKHGLGLRYYNRQSGDRELEIICDQFPTTGNQVENFKRHIVEHNERALGRAGITIKPQLIGEAKSHAHIILQATDVILGSMNFRLNDLHKAKPLGKFRRGKKTVVKEKVFRKISSRIRKIYPNFNIGISTGHRGDIANRWNDPYRHWCFEPANSVRDDSAVKE
ncbi:MAG: DUF3800 domain-containing protein [Sphingomonadales bacterium]|nr:DUF3800 domain-containing protein [Sphingomonadales bacterium]PIX66369.1 MAG: hypothetical protein COZ43_06810 [Sphingomonadales bacterium CG_4_10_14_3_um_filter_58_15]NCO48180.1 DUF3800 domain-containing protein [Sphingomonadales bacterium]NCO99791.1 DUF3800 domain-containing protein [Sphingomonadales bacterium]NCP28157.1 DUF3800 domain-containing protein [Sphingomonadales bacterium]